MKTRSYLFWAACAVLTLMAVHDSEAGRGGFGGGGRGGFGGGGRSFGGGGFSGGGRSFGGGGYGGGGRSYGGGFGGGGYGGGGGFDMSRAGGYGGMQGARGGMNYGGGMNSGMGASRGGYGMGGATEFNRTPSFGGSANYGGYGGVRDAGANPYAGGGMRSQAGAVDVNSGSKTGSYTTDRGTDIQYGVAGVGARGPEGGAAGRAVGGVDVTTEGGRSYTDVGRAAGVVGPDGGAAGRRGNLAVASGPNGTVADASRRSGVVGPDGGAAVRGGNVLAGEGRNGAFADVSRRGAVVGPDGGVAGRSTNAVGVRGDRAAGWGWHNSNYAGYHSGWVHGYWAGQYPGWGYGGWGAYGAGVATGAAFWGLGSALYGYGGGWGYMPYVNPYYVAPTVVDAAPVYDYAQPIDTMAAAPDASVADPAVSSFDQARQAFKQGDYETTLSLSDQAIQAMPNDSALHEFRAQALFALGRYDEAAASLYSVLSVGPGWDWTTMISLYPSIDVFTAQQRALEQYVQANPKSASSRFVLAYIYLTEGQNEPALGMLKQVTALQPSDRVSAMLVSSLSSGQDAAQPGQAPAASAADSAQPAPTAKPAVASSTVQGKLAGTFTASPDGKTSIELSLTPDQKFAWKVTQGGQSHTIDGTFSATSDVLTLAPTNGGTPMVGQVNWADASSFTFQALGGGASDPGLRFQKK